MKQKINREIKNKRERKTKIEIKVESKAKVIRDRQSSTAARQPPVSLREINVLQF